MHLPNHVYVQIPVGAIPGAEGIYNTRVNLKKNAVHHHKGVDFLINAAVGFSILEQIHKQFKIPLAQAHSLNIAIFTVDGLELTTLIKNEHILWKTCEVMHQFPMEVDYLAACTINQDFDYLVCFEKNLHLSRNEDIRVRFIANAQDSSAPLLNLHYFNESLDIWVACIPGTDLYSELYLEIKSLDYLSKNFNLYLNNSIYSNNESFTQL